jgi:hypothetical protein
VKRLNRYVERCVQCGKPIPNPVINLPLEYMKTAEFEYVCSKKCSEDFDWEVCIIASGG